MYLLWTPSSFCFLHNRWINPRDKVLRQRIQLYSESQLTKKMADFTGINPKITILSKSGSQVLSWIRDEGRWGNKVRTHLILQISPKMASLRYYLSFISSVVWNGISCCHMNKHGNHTYLWLQPAICEFLSHTWRIPFSTQRT